MVLVCRTLVVLCLLATITSTLRVYPHQLAYFNEAAGGPENGYKHLLHSNLDWGQDWLYLHAWAIAHAKKDDSPLQARGEAMYDPGNLMAGLTCRTGGPHEKLYSAVLAVGITEVSRRCSNSVSMGDGCLQDSAMICSLDDRRLTCRVGYTFCIFSK